MGKLDRYIGLHVFFAILAVLGVIVGLVLLFAFIDELGDVKGSYGTLDALIYVLLTMPRRIYEMLPMAALIGCLIGLGTLASSSELTIMRAAGVSLGQIVWAVMKPMLMLMLVGFAIGEYLAPWSEDLAQAGRSLAQGRGEAQSSKNGLWHRQGNEFIHINSVQPGGVLLGVTRYDFDSGQNLLSASFARQANYQQDHWVLHDISITHFRDGYTEVNGVGEQRWDVELTPSLLSIVVLEPEALSMTGLWNYIHYLAEQNLNNNRYWLAFWTKTLQPLVVVALVLMAISFVFGPLRSVTLGQRVFTGVIVGFVFRIIQDLLGPASQVFNFSPFLAVILPATSCGLAGLWLLRKAG
ncbi:LPS export ABC transporter permease LptG [Azomonas macrocytogenes]|uniref:Lipopolysaccharide export system permease protein n=1 Tax=Azomonas macrocytogenes TaxID=69962 RepID=A0A839T083_AZOMA|nr:LPS export ABC transporter permease LptG [Azomonas macrocytogenes]MBB3101916.1 lipopolysaccharide export system permease protein [Azomonas macrocytogenes]